MLKNNTVSSQFFVNKFNLQPYQRGRLDGLTFAVKDLIDISGTTTGFGHPHWSKTHARAEVNAVCVDQLLSEGATCLGKTITDELAFSLMGENFFYGTPLNPKASDRVPGGSSSGSAAAVAANIVDFALGTDTGGSVRVPASNCGIWGYRFSHGLISMAGVRGVAPTFDTLGLFANDAHLLNRVGNLLLGSSPSETQITSTFNFFLLKDIFDLCDEDVKIETLQNLKKSERTFAMKEITLEKIFTSSLTYKWLINTYLLLQNCEIWNVLGDWLEKNKDQLSPTTQHNFFNIAKTADRTKVQSYVEKREWFAKNLNRFLQKNILCFPTTPTFAPKLKTTPENFTARTLAINTIASLARTPQLTVPLNTQNNVPLGLSFVCAYGNDEWLLNLGLRLSLSS